jgi:predicted lipid carrier protein YhbT
VLAQFANAFVRALKRSHPKLLANLTRLEPAIVHIVPTDLPYRFAISLGREPIRLSIIEQGGVGADAEVAADVSTLIDLFEGRTDSDTLFFRRDLAISGNTSVIVGLRNVLDREELRLKDEIAAIFGPLGRPARTVARWCDRVLDGVGARVAAIHRTLHSPAETAPDVRSELERCEGEIAALTARLARLEARQKRRDEKIA